MPTRLSGRVESFTTTLLEAEIRIGRQDQVVDLQALGGELLLGAEDVRVVLREGAHAHQAVQRAGRLVAVTPRRIPRAAAADRGTISARA